VELEREAITQIWWFACVGLANTFIDVGLFNRLTRHPALLSGVPASLVSTTAGMVFGFTMHFAFVFQPEHPDLLVRMFSFMWVNLVSCYIIQSSVILAATRHSPRIIRRSGQFICQNAWAGKLDTDFVERNLVKGLAVLAGLTWNFCWYKFYVFA
jgi:putative flippase GtrA